MNNPKEEHEVRELMSAELKKVAGGSHIVTIHASHFHIGKINHGRMGEAALNTEAPNINVGIGELHVPED